MENKNSSTFYAQLCNRDNGNITGKDFDYVNLLKGNFIDLGVFVHNRQCFEQLGGFDIRFKRLVDWDLILTYTKVYLPVFIPHVLLDYNNGTSADRISNRESAALAKVEIVKKHSSTPTVTTIILSYNQEKYIKHAIDSALSQKGEFVQEIIISDDGSTDQTPSIIQEYCKKHPLVIRSIGTHENIGISQNFKRSIAQ